MTLGGKALIDSSSAETELYLILIYSSIIRVDSSRVHRKSTWGGQTTCMTSSNLCKYTLVTFLITILLESLAQPVYQTKPRV